MHQSQAMPHLVSNHVFQRLIHNIVGHILCPHGRIELCRLKDTPVIQRPCHIIINKNTGIQNLSRHRVDPGNSLGILMRVRYITYTRVFQVSRVKFGVIRREVFHLNGIFKPDLLESLVPSQYTFFNRLFPVLREIGIHVHHNRFHGLGQHSLPISFRIFGLQTPAMHVRIGTNVTPLFRNITFIRKESTDTGVREPGTHSFLR